MVMGLVSGWSLANHSNSVFPGGTPIAQPRWMLARGILGNGRTCGVSFRPFPNSSSWWWVISSVFLSKISSHKTTHANGYYGAWPGWAVSISVLPLTLLAVRQTRTWDPLQRCCHACIWTSLSLSNKVQRNYMGLKITACICSWDKFWTKGYKKTNKQTNKKPQKPTATSEALCCA